MRPPKATDQEIIQAARAIFIEHGIHAPVTAIAKKLGISQPALFKRFGTKKNLLAKALSPEIDPPKWTIQAKAAPDERPFPEQFRELCKGIMEFLIEITPIIRLVHTSDFNFTMLGDQKQENPYQRDIKLLAQWLSNCWKKGFIRKMNFTLAAHSIMGTLKMDTFELSFHHNMDAATIRKKQLAYLDGCLDILWHGLQPGKSK